MDHGSTKLFYHMLITSSPLQSSIPSMSINYPTKSILNYIVGKKKRIDSNQLHHPKKRTKEKILSATLLPQTRKKTPKNISKSTSIHPTDEPHGSSSALPPPSVAPAEGAQPAAPRRVRGAGGSASCGAPRQGHVVDLFD